MSEFLLWLSAHLGWVIGLSVAIFILLTGVSLILLTAAIVFRKTLYKKNLKPRKREFSFNAPEPHPPHIKDQSKMFEEGIAWAEQHKDKIKDLHMVNDKLDLYGQYIDFGFDKCAIVLQGRTESLLYSYYFSQAYAKKGYNILVIDVRTHGLSDGKFVTAGIHESRDLIKWIKLVKEQFNIESFVVHGICIGGATGILAYDTLKKQNDPDYKLIKKLVVDGTFPTFYSIFARHHKERKKPRMFIPIVFFYLWLCTGACMFKTTPIKAIKSVDDIPMLFMYSKEDFYVPPKNGQKLFDACPSPKKELKFFPKGRHSHVRFNNTEAYDAAIEEFLSRE